MNKDFFEFLKNSKQEIFIEAEAKKDKMSKFIESYNNNYSETINFDTNGICLLGDVDKWGVELRIYFNNINNIPDYWKNRMYKNKKYLEYYKI